MRDGNSTRLTASLLPALVAVVLQSTSPLALAQGAQATPEAKAPVVQPTPEAKAQAEQLRKEMLEALQSRDYPAVLERAETYRALESEGVKMPAGLYFAEAEAAKSSGDWLRARAALAAYLERASEKDALYVEALKLHPVIETEIARQYEAQLRAEKEAREASERALAERKAAERRRALEQLVADMVVIPAGKFRMGDLSGRGDEDELPVHTVQVPGFRLGRYEVTFDQYDAFCEATGRPRPDDKGWGRGNRPVMNVNWQDATDFIGWASEQTGQRFRLPTEAEWEYAARAGTVTDYWWGDAFSFDHANASGTSGRDTYSTTAPVGQFPANAFGLHDMNGNVREWVQDCWLPDYQDKVKTAVARTGGDCSRRVVRGGAWNLGPAWQRSSDRDSDEQRYRFVDRGFRLALDL